MLSRAGGDQGPAPTTVGNDGQSVTPLEQPNMTPPQPHYLVSTLHDSATPSPDRIIDPAELSLHGCVSSATPILDVLSAGENFPDSHHRWRKDGSVQGHRSLDGVAMMWISQGIEAAVLAVDRKP
jgi:hypothetical protein